MRFFFNIVFVLGFIVSTAQIKDVNGFGIGKTFGNNQNDSLDVFNASNTAFKIPPISFYKKHTLEKDTTFLDTTINIQKEYAFNMLRKDLFGLLAFANEGQSYNTLNFGFDI